jgi:hypothetical protein
VKYRAASLSSDLMFDIQGQHIECVCQCAHLGHIAMQNNNYCEDILHRRNMLCTQTNNVLCYFMRRHSTTILKLLIAFCYSFYGSVLWDLSNLHIKKFCQTCHKGLRCALDIPADAHSKFIPILAGTLPTLDELVERTVNFIQ